MTDEATNSPRRLAYVRVRLRKIKAEIALCRDNLARMRAGEPGDGDPRVYYFVRIEELRAEREALRAELGETGAEAAETELS